MSRLIGFLAVTACSWAGWSAGAWHSLGSAVMLGIVGTGVGLYLGRRIVADHF